MFLEGLVIGASACIVGVGLSAEQTCPLDSLFQIFISFKCDMGGGGKESKEATCLRQRSYPARQGLGYPTSTLPSTPNSKDCRPHFFPR